MPDTHTGSNPFASERHVSARTVHVRVNAQCIVVLFFLFIAVFFAVVFIIVGDAVIAVFTNKTGSYRACSEMSVNSNPAAK